MTLRVEDDKLQLSIYKNDKLQKKENEVCMRVEAIPMQEVEIRKKVPKKTTVKGINVTLPGEKQRGQKLNVRINSKVDQNEMVPFLRTVDVMYVSFEGNEKSIDLKKNKKKQKTSILPKNLISVCFRKLDQEPISHSTGLSEKFIIH